VAARSTTRWRWTFLGLDALLVALVLLYFAARDSVPLGVRQTMLAAIMAVGVALVVMGAKALRR
jgi:phosphate/sulfate permease